MPNRTLAVLSVGLVGISSALAGEDCNDNGIPDEFDIRPTLALEAPTNYLAAILSTAMAVGDVNGDFYPDVIAISPNDSYSVLINRGDGTFPYPARFPAGDRPVGVGLADLDGDNDLDLVIASRDDDRLRLYRNNGVGTFSNYGSYQLLVGSTYRSLVIARLNADAIDDVALLYDGGVVVMLGDGVDGFILGPDGLTLRAVGTQPSAIIAADLNNDGDNELIVANGGSDNISVLTGNGNGSFQPAVNYAVGDNPRNLAAGDLNGDGFAEVVTANLNSDTASLLTNAGTPAGVFTGGGTPIVVNDGPSGVAILNLDADTDRDLVITHRDGTALILRNNGTGSFTTAISPAARFAAAVSSGDVERDGDPDLLVLSTASVMTVLRNDGGGGFPPLPTRLSGLGSPFDIAAANFMGDAGVDLAISDISSNRIDLFRNNAGTFVSAGEIVTGGEPLAVVTAHLNADNLPDLAASALDTGQVAVALNNGNGTFSSTLLPVATSIVDIEPVDYDGDGDIDILASYPGVEDAGCQCFLGGSVYMLANNGSGVFSVAGSFSALNGSGPLAVGRFNADSLPDLAVASLDSDGIRIFLNSGGTFVGGSILVHGADHFDLAAGDLNGDGFDDLVSARYNIADFIPDGVAVLLADGTGAFLPAVTYPASSVLGLTVADLDGDDDLDIGTANAPTDDVTTLANNGDGTFAPGTSWLGVSGAAGIAVMDLDADQRPEVLVAGFNPPGVLAILRTQSQPPVSDDANGDGVPDECETVCVGDLNGDNLVNLSDLTILLAHFGVQTGAELEDGDLSGDGDVDLSDLTLFLTRFGTVCD